MIQMKPTCGHTVTFTKAKGDEDQYSSPGPGEYAEIWSDGKKKADIGCPGCKTYLFLERHQIDPDGTVHPSVGCNQCGWHEFIKLEGWSP